MVEIPRSWRRSSQDEDREPSCDDENFANKQPLNRLYLEYGFHFVMPVM